MEDGLKCQISPLVKYRQNQNTCTVKKNPRLLTLPGLLN